MECKDVFITLDDKHSLHMFGENKPYHFVALLPQQIYIKESNRIALLEFSSLLNKAAFDNKKNNQNKLYIYCNMIQEQPTQGTMEKLLRTVDIQNQNNITIFNDFMQLRYMPVKSGFYDYVEIFINYGKDEKASFLDSPCTLTLHII